jgi:hypothetical protein
MVFVATFGTNLVVLLLFRVDGANPVMELQLNRPSGMPKLGSIVVAIDSIWGDSDYQVGCLYRFRVHGDENNE